VLEWNTGDGDGVYSSTVRTRIEEKCARTLELPLLVSASYIPFLLSQLGAEFAMFPPRVAQKGNSNVLAHFSSIRVLTVLLPRRPTKDLSYWSEVLVICG